MGAGPALGMVPRVMSDSPGDSWMGSNTANASGTAAPLDMTTDRRDWPGAYIF